MTVSIEVCASDLSRFFFKSHFPQFLLDIVVVSKSSKCSAKKNIKKRSSTHTHSRLDPNRSMDATTHFGNMVIVTAMVVPMYLFSAEY